MSKTKSKAKKNNDEIPRNPRKAVKDQVHTLGEDLAKLTQLAREAAREEMARAKERAGDATQDARDSAAAWEQRMEHSVRQNPVKSVLYATGAGLLLGLFLRR